ETVKDLAMGIDVEAGGFLPVEWAKRDEVCPGPLERYGRADDIDDVAGGADLLELLGRDEAGHAAGYPKRLALIHDFVDGPLALTPDAAVATDPLVVPRGGTNQDHIKVIVGRATRQRIVE